MPISKNRQALKQYSPRYTCTWYPCSTTSSNVLPGRSNFSDGSTTFELMESSSQNGPNRKSDMSMSTNEEIQIGRVIRVLLVRNCVSGKCKYVFGTAKKSPS
jgi:hypothetical protein